ncbi:Rho GTPase activation protein [Guyanagaster necrorhizus]|uniref:Rho GTPase activation protein n=1 Tax=Guyanagaster necrorhizus TaxID=856835 RepID=A0A9P7W2P0_9AGAR|nr:Rho GTPase activation protein [Guyanagaster necrorhizus MCA 3950]KAG7451300.1 Rho GTPase activation protein [Guyanagaster necrorhizus MCA 3950]
MQSPPYAPTKANLKAWWNQFNFVQKVKKEVDSKEDSEHPVFGKPLKESLRYASVQISTANANGELFVWGYIPVVVAKCGLYLKEIGLISLYRPRIVLIVTSATEVPGTFRVNGSTKRMRELQAAFESPPRYGKSLDWKQVSCTSHDVASVFRRYLTQMPEPVIPYDMYHDFRDALAKQPYNQDEVIVTYKRLIRAMPRANQYLLLYVLDLLSVFARKSDINLMTATNLAVIFRPGLISHPHHEMSPKEHALSQQVLEFLIAQQDWFMLDIPPPPQNTSGSPISDSSVDDITVFPSSDDERQPGSGWKMVGKKDMRRVTRRRTTLDRSAAPHVTVAETDLPPVNETPPSRPEDGLVGVSRSRTLPSGRRVTSSSSDAPRLLRKQKRASSSQPTQTRGGQDPMATTS